MPPTKKTPPASTLDLGNIVRDLISRRKLTPHSVAAAAGLDPPSVYRFIDGAGLNMRSLSKVMHALGLVVTEGRAGLGKSKP
jgi:predicted transcriptional regulator